MVVVVVESCVNQMVRISEMKDKTLSFTSLLFKSKSIKYFGLPSNIMVSFHHPHTSFPTLACISISSIQFHHTCNELIDKTCWHELEHISSSMSPFESSFKPIQLITLLMWHGG